jgi:hypothetical protein
MTVHTNLHIEYLRCIFDISVLYHVREEKATDIDEFFEKSVVFHTEIKQRQVGKPRKYSRKYFSEDQKNSVKHLAIPRVL